MTPCAIKTNAVITVHTTSRRLLPCVYIARSLLPVSRYFQTIQPSPIWAAANERPTTIIVIMNCRSRAGAWSEMAAGNHHFPLTNSSTESSVIIQIITARTRPIGYISFGLICVRGLLAIQKLAIQHHQDKQQRQVEY